ncbi:uncharacterized protein LOC5513836 [Nematostella vectensis]|uniref:uncharacterized protein LOC5513836 n=1 Tax=Nematostella vectensis TaxID=45351 RepID=UPI002076EE10|nr:uncharacterized protein LOC5513836 [Nematostella vectensis]
MKRHLLILFLALMAISADLVSGHGATNSSCDRIPRGSRRFYGRSPNMPGKSCMDILNKNLSIRNNGIYWIKLNGYSAFPVFCDMKDGGWTMVLKLVSGSGEDVADLWEAPFAIREFDQRLLHLMPVHNWPYKNKIVRQWNVFKPEEARVVLYKRGAKVLTVGFNAIDSNKMNWFSSSRLVDSPWSDLGKEPKNFFTIKGDTAHNRHFFINRSYEGGCHVDFGWLVTGQLWRCKWEQGYKKAAFLYSKIGTHTNWNKHENVGSADVFTVFVR